MDKLKQYQSSISTALATSPMARVIHDAYYKSNFFKYGQTPKSISQAYVDFTDDDEYQDVRLVFKSQQQEARTVRSIQHELVHVGQLGQACDHKIPISPRYLSYDEFLALRLIWEAHAFAVETEGPITGLLDSLKTNDTKKLELYEALFEEEKEASLDAYNQRKVFFETMFDKKLPMPGIFDSVAYEYYNDFSFWDDKKIAEKKQKGRKGLIKDFFSTVVLKNNSRLDEYILSLSDSYEVSNKTNIQLAENLNSMSGVGHIKKEEQRESYLKSILKTTAVDSENYLSENDWYDALQAKSTSELVNRVLFFSEHKNNMDIQKKRSAGYKL